MDEPVADLHHDLAWAEQMLAIACQYMLEVSWEEFVRRNTTLYRRFNSWAECVAYWKQRADRCREQIEERERHGG